ncbi:guanine nucleotide-binding protein G(o) subunit alpha-like [Oppia nitens]|uniref:guanine nucleotide-binding protein G(o) subunit alpha-like n=1 Tax=Oppia nitens TaxID=1686743 RepID=UPI0023DA1586|nr:guanine nucleotide-binding protein G(o) subunit alpha-like [Oppia nitens]
MGTCFSLQDIEQRKSDLLSKEIDRQLEECEKQDRNVIKILILGTGESGKSTLVKQMKIIHNDGYTKDEMKSFRLTILDNLVTSMKYVLIGMRFLSINYEIADNKEFAQLILNCNQYYDEFSTLVPNIVTALQSLWIDKGVREGVARGFEYELNDSALYFFENINRITNEKYIPNTTDVLRARVRTRGVVETEFKVENLVIKMFDVGGQRSERKKWVQCFDDVRALLFVVAISEYDMTLIENPNKNRLRESFQLFGNFSNNIYFRFTTTLLFLNKLDLFREKILFTDRQLRYFVSEYTGPDRDCDAAALFIQHRFNDISIVRNQNKQIYCHFTTATDTSNVKEVFQSVIHTIVSQNLRQSLLI